MIADETALEDLLATPSPELVAELSAGDGDIVVLGAAGKMGPTLCMLAARALAAFSRLSWMRSGSMSTPTPRQP